MNNKSTQLKGAAFLLTTAFVWGVSFVAQSEGMAAGGFTFNAARMILGGLVLIPLILKMDRQKAASMTGEQMAEKKTQDKKTIRSGLLLGVVFCVASNLQQFAFMESSSGKIAFITTMYMFFVPLLGMPFGKRISGKTWLCVFLGFLGLFFLCLDPGNLTAINGGDVLALLGAVGFAIHTLAIEKFAGEYDGTKLSCVQFLVGGVLSGIMMLFFENPQVSVVLQAWLPIAYAGIISCGVGYTFQIIGQKYVEATAASLLLSMESVFAVLAAAVLLKEHLAGREILGCCIMFGAIILSQLVQAKEAAQSE